MWVNFSTHKKQQKEKSFHTTMNVNIKNPTVLEPERTLRVTTPTSSYRQNLGDWEKGLAQVPVSPGCSPGLRPGYMAILHYLFQQTRLLALQHLQDALKAQSGHLWWVGDPFRRSSQVKTMFKIVSDITCFFHSHSLMGIQWSLPENTW